MKKIYLILFYIAIISDPQLLSAQTPVTEWVSAYAGASPGSSKIIHDQEGNTYVAGTFDWGQGPYHFSDIFIIKYDVFGNVLWQHVIGGDGSDGVSSIEVSDGHVFIYGIFSWTVDFDPGPGVAELTDPSSNLFLLSLDQVTGDFSWVKQIDGDINTDEIYIFNNFIYLTGWFQGTVDFDPNNGTHYETSSTSNWSGFYAKYTTSGNYVDMQVVGGPQGSVLGTKMAMDNAGNAYLVGTFIGTINTYPATGGDGAITAPPGTNVADVYVIKHDFAATTNINIWGVKFGGAYDDELSGAAFTDKLIIAGNFRGTIDFNPGTATTNFTSAGLRDIYLNAFDANGNYQWTKTIGGTADDVVYDLKKYNNEVYFGGSFTGTVDFNPGTATNNLISTGNKDVFVSKMTSAGVFGWAKKFGSVNEDYCSSLSVQNQYDVFFTGNCNTYQGDATFDSHTLSSQTAGTFPVFICKLKHPCPPTSSTITFGSCNPYVLNGQTYSQSGQYTQTRTNAHGCDSIITVNFTRYIPTSSNLTRMGCLNFSLNGSTYNSSGNYIQHVSNSHGCDSTIYLSLTIINLNTDVSLTGYILSATQNNVDYQWINCSAGNTPIPGANSQNFTPSIPANYAVELSYEGCTETSSCVTVISVGIEENVQDAFKLFPNPSTGLVTITSFSEMNGAVLKVYTTTGQVIQTKEDIHGNEYSLDLSMAAPGVYFAELIQDGKVSRKKLVKE